MGKLAEAYVEIGSKTKGFDDGLAASEKSLSAFVGRSSALLAGLGAAAIGAAGVRATVDFLKDAARAASDLNEAANKTRVIYGDAAGEILGFAQSMADKFGFVKTETLEAASNFGMLFQGAGMSAAEASKLSQSLVKLAGDAGSINNVNLPDALQKIRAGLVGESEPLRVFGVMLSEDRVKLAAYASGIAEVGRELTDQQKVAARAAIITQDLAYASGDLDRTIGDLANAQRRLNGDIENFKAKIGEDVDAVMLETIKLAYDMGDAFTTAFDTTPLDAFKAAMGGLKSELAGFRIIFRGLAMGGDFSGASEKMLGEQIAKALGDTAADAMGVGKGAKNPPSRPAPGKLGKFLFGGEGGAHDVFGMMGLLSPFGMLSPLGQAALRTEPRRYEERSVKTDVVSFGADAIMRSLEGSQSPMAKQLEEQKRANEHLKDIVDELKRGNARPSGKPGVFPNRRR